MTSGSARPRGPGRGRRSTDLPGEQLESDDALVAVAVADPNGHAGAGLDHGVEGGPQRVVGPDLELEGADLSVADPAPLDRLARVGPAEPHPGAVHHPH